MQMTDDFRVGSLPTVALLFETAITIICESEFFVTVQKQA